MSKYNLAKFFTINFLKLLAIESLPSLNHDNYVIRGCLKSELEEAERIYKTLNSRGFSRIQKMLLMLFSNKNLIITISNQNGYKKIVGINLYYINHRDFKENTIHEGFIGVIPESEGRGIATKMRKQAIEHFRNAGFKGISTRISQNNLGSLNSARKLGFEPVEEYFDSVMGEDRYYLIYNLRNESDK